MAKAPAVAVYPVHRHGFLHRLARDYKLNKYKYLLIIPVLIILAIFAYKPMYGLIIAFKNFRPRLGIEGSKWVGLQNFANFFGDVYFGRLLRNTLSISLLNILFGFPLPIILALMLNEVRKNSFKRTVQTITYMPYFVSMVVSCALVRVYCQNNGIFADILVSLGAPRQNLLTDPRYFYPSILFPTSGSLLDGTQSSIWQHCLALTRNNMKPPASMVLDASNRCFISLCLA